MIAVYLCGFHDVLIGFVGFMSFKKWDVNAIGTCVWGVLFAGVTSSPISVHKCRSERGWVPCNTSLQGVITHL